MNLHDRSLTDVGGMDYISSSSSEVFTAWQQWTCPVLQCHTWPSHTLDLLDPVTRISISIQSPHHHRASTMTGFIMSSFLTSEANINVSWLLEQDWFFMSRTTQTASKLLKMDRGYQKNFPGQFPLAIANFIIIGDSSVQIQSAPHILDKNFGICHGHQAELSNWQIHILAPAKQVAVVLTIRKNYAFVPWTPWIPGELNISCLSLGHELRNTHLT